MRKLCDGVPDCSDGWDEGPHCRGTAHTDTHYSVLLYHSSACVFILTSPQVECLFFNQSFHCIYTCHSVHILFYWCSSSVFAIAKKADFPTVGLKKVYPISSPLLWVKIHQPASSRLSRLCAAIPNCNLCPIISIRLFNELPYSGCCSYNGMSLSGGKKVINLSISSATRLFPRSLRERRAFSTDAAARASHRILGY